MDTITRNKIIDNAIKKGHNKDIKEKLQKLLIERQIPFTTDDVEFRKPIASGSYGIVELVRYQKKLYAHKKPNASNHEKYNNVLEEAIKLTDIAQYHPNIQQLYFINLKTFGFLMDYCDCGPLDKVVTNTSSTYTLVDALNWSYQLADALSFLHTNNIMHRDIKMQNILLKDNCQTIVLTDYGTATQLGKSWMTDNVGTPITMAPEVFAYNQYDEQCDIYSWSIVFWQLLSKQYSPYDNQNLTSFSLMLKILTEKLRPKLLNNCPEILIALMYRSWHSNPYERPTVSFIKKTLRLLLNVLPKNAQVYSEEMVSEVKKQCMNESTLLEKYLPYEPRLNSEKSMNIYHQHLNKMRTIVNVQQDILKLNQEVNEYTKQNDARYDYHEELVKENQKLQEQIKKLREKNHH